MALAPKGFYVYLLIDPRDGAVFYVGKGKGRRVYSHERDAKRFDAANPRKTQRILAILADGVRVETLIVQEGLAEEDAFALERKLIAKHGKARLTNHSSGVRTHEERARLLLSRVKPFDAWAAETKAGPAAQQLYRDIVEELQKVANGSLRNLPACVSFESGGSLPARFRNAS